MTCDESKRRQASAKSPCDVALSPAAVVRRGATAATARWRVSKVCGFADVDAVVTRTRSEVLRRENEAPLPLLPRFADSQRVVGEIGDEFVSRQRRNTGNARIAALVPREGQEIICDSVRDLQAKNATRAVRWRRAFAVSRELSRVWREVCAITAVANTHDGVVSLHSGQKLLRLLRGALIVT